jgi:hypothetical protein
MNDEKDLYTPLDKGSVQKAMNLQAVVKGQKVFKSKFETGQSDPMAKIAQAAADHSVASGKKKK